MYLSCAIPIWSDMALWRIFLSWSFSAIAVVTWLDHRMVYELLACSNPTFSWSSQAYDCVLMCIFHSLSVIHFTIGVAVWVSFGASNRSRLDLISLSEF